MGLFNKKPVATGICKVCGATKKVKDMTKDSLCFDCIVVESRIKQTLQSKKTDAVKSNEVNNILRTKQFKATKKIHNGIFDLEFDGVNKLFRYSKKPLNIFAFSEILDFQLIENGQTTTNNNLGNAVAGGLLFGAAGAIVGSGVNKKTKNEVTEFKINIILASEISNVLTINLLVGKSKRDSITFKSTKKIADTIIGELTKITATQSASSNSLSAHDEILKLKNLLDIEAITQQEFEAKKKQLLNL